MSRHWPTSTAMPRSRATAAVVGHLTGMKPDLHFGALRWRRPVAFPDRDLDVARARHCAARRLERHHEPVAESFHHDASVALDELERRLLELTPDGIGR